MILPTNGKVVVFDDQHDQVQELLKVLSKERVPYVYYQDELGEDLPDKPIRNVRLIFLDIQLVSGQTLSNHNIISSIGIRLQKVLEKNNNYILIYWSTKKDKYKDVLNNAFEDKLKDYKPIITLSLDKNEALRPENNTIDLIVNEMKAKSENFNLFKIFALWENLVNNSAGYLINDFTNFIGKDAHWDDSTKYVLYKLSEAYSGKTIKDKSETEQLEDALFTLNHTLIDTIENRIPSTIDKKKDILVDIISDKQNGEDYSSIINNKLLLSEMNFNGKVPGCLFFIEEELKEKFIQHKSSFNSELEKIKNNDKISEDKKPSIIKKKEINYKSQIDSLKLFQQSINKNFNVIVNSVIAITEPDERKSLRDNIIANSIKIELNISPLCDYAQEKMLCVRIIPGLLLKSKYKGELNIQNAYNYFSDCVIKFRDEDYYLLFDFRFLYSKSESFLKSRISKNKLRHQLLSDIQLKLGSHVSRSGVIYVQ